MKICIPIERNDGKNSIPYGHFGSAPMLAICDTETGEVEIINKGAHDSGGACNPTGYLEGRDVSAFIVGGIGVRAIARLNDCGIKIYRSAPGSIADNIALFNSGQLDELTPDGGCSHGH